jgi:hypothetical protein
MTATRTLRRAFDKQAVALFTLPLDPHAWLPPYTPGLVQHTLELCLAIGIDITGIAVGPLAELGGVSRALDAPDMAALSAGSGGWRDKQGIALVAGATDTLLDGLIGQLSTRPCRDGQQLLLLGSTGAFLVLVLALVGDGPLLGIAGALLATLVLALGTDLVGAIRGSAVVTGTMDAHADRLFNTLDADGVGGRGDPLVGLEGQSVLCKQGTGSLLLESTAVEFLSDGVGAPGNCAGSRRSQSGSGTAWVSIHVQLFSGYRFSYAGVASFSSLGSTGAEGTVEASGLLLLLPLSDFSRLKTLLMRLTYLPRLLRRSTSFGSSAGGTPDDDILLFLEIFYFWVVLCGVEW